MTDRQHALAARRALLAARCQTYRDTLTEEFNAWQARALTADRWLGAIAHYRALVAMGIGLGAIVGLRHRNALVRWAKRGWMAWGILRSLRAGRGS